MYNDEQIEDEAISKKTYFVQNIFTTQYNIAFSTHTTKTYSHCIAIKAKINKPIPLKTKTLIIVLYFMECDIKEIFLNTKLR